VPAAEALVFVVLIALAKLVAAEDPIAAAIAFPAPMIVDTPTADIFACWILVPLAKTSTCEKTEPWPEATANPTAVAVEVPKTMPEAEVIDVG